MFKCARISRSMLVGLLVVVFVSGALAVSCAADPTPTPRPTATAKPTATATPTPPPKPQELVVGIVADPAMLDTALHTSPSVHTPATNFMDSLVTVEPSDMKPDVPSLAVSWRMVDPTTWEFKLRPGVKFHDGTAMTADDVAYVVDRILDPETKSYWRTRGALLDSAEVVDSQTVRIHTTNPSHLVLDQFTKVGISPRAYVQDRGESYAKMHPVGAGPFRFIEWVKDTRIVGEAFPDYWGGEASIKRIVMRPIPEDAVRVAAFKSGAIQLAIKVPYDDIADLDSRAESQVVKTRTLTVMQYVLNTYDPPALRDKRVRQALNYAIDKDSLIEHIMLGNGIKLDGQLTSPLYFGHNPNLQPYPYDPDKARQLLADAGYADGFDLPIISTIGYYSKDKELTEAIAGQLSKVGIRPTTRAVEYSVWAPYVREKGPGAVIRGFTWPPHTLFLLKGWGSGSYKAAYWDNEEFSDLFERAGKEADSDAQKQLIWSALELMREEAPTIWLWEAVDAFAVDSRLVGFEPIPDGRLWLYPVAYR